jgi:hypothetical protein
LSETQEWNADADPFAFADAVDAVVRARETRFVHLSQICDKLDQLVGLGFGFSDDDWRVLDEELEPSVTRFEAGHVDEELFALAYLSKDVLPGDRLPGGLEAEEDVRVQTRRKQQFAGLRDEEAICRLFELSPTAFAQHRQRLKLLRDEDVIESARLSASYFLGIAFGRFNASRLGTAVLSDPADAPAPATRAAKCGVLVDDPGHKDDVVRQLERGAIGVRAPGRLLDSLREVLSPESEDIRGWLRNGFFDDHVRRYSKSRRKAPIYWQLSTASGAYSVWLYYYALVQDSLYRVLNEYIAPKLAHEERKLSNLVQDAGSSPAPSQRKEIDSQATLVDDLRAFQIEVSWVAPLWSPDLNDGVIINFAPLWRLVPQHRAWQKECKSCWDKLVAGDYDWAHLAMHLWPERIVPKCAEDRSLAIAHGVEEVFWVEGDDGKWQPRQVDPAIIDQLIKERTSAAVKDALKSLLEAPAPTTKRSTTRAKGTRRKSSLRTSRSAATNGPDPSMLAQGKAVDGSVAKIGVPRGDRDDIAGEAHA